VCACVYAECVWCARARAYARARAVCGMWCMCVGVRVCARARVCARVWYALAGLDVEKLAVDEVPLREDGREGAEGQLNEKEEKPVLGDSLHVIARNYKDIS
jgi:hypothetical protein